MSHLGRVPEAWTAVPAGEGAGEILRALRSLAVSDPRGELGMLAGEAAELLGRVLRM